MKKIIAVILIVAVVIVGGFIWWKAPVHFLNGEDVAYIEVFNGNNGNSFVIDGKEDITYIADNIADAKLKKTKISVGYKGYGFRLSFFKDNGKKVEEFIINSEDVIRKDPFFYKCEIGELCYKYLWEIESRVCAE